MTIPGIFSQRDPRWSSLELGYNGDPYYNLYHFGCLVTAVSNMLWWNGNNGADPGAVNQWLKDNGGFLPGGGNMIWGAIQPLLDQVNMVQRGFSSDLNAVNAFLQDENNFAIAQLTKPGFPMHFSAMPYVGKIADSWDAQLKDVGAYTFVGAHLYSKNAAVVQPAPQPEPTPPAAPTVLPPLNPDPVPVPSNEEPIPEPGRGSGGVSNGQPSGPVNVTVIPSQPDILSETEYDETFHPDVRDVWLSEPTVAVDITGQSAPIHINDTTRPYKVKGWFTDNGRKYWQGTKDHPNGEIYGIPDDDISKPEVPPTPAKDNFWGQFFKDPLGALIRLFSRNR